MYKARIGVFYKEQKRTNTFEYLMHPNVKEINAVKLNDDLMIDIDNLNMYPIIKRNKKGYLDCDIKLNQEYVISSTLAEPKNMKEYLKCMNAKVKGLMELSKEEPEHKKVKKI